MRRPILAALLLAGSLVFGVPLGSAAAQIEIADADVYNQEGQALTRAAVGQAVRLQAKVNNTGNETYNATLEVVFLVMSDDGYNFNRTITTNESLEPEEETLVTLDWIPVRTGDHTVQMYVEENPDDIFTLRFTVAQSEVARESLPQLVLNYVWVYAAFLVALVLFFAVVRHRRAH